MVASTLAAPNKTDKTDLSRDNEGDVDLTDNTITVSELGEALEGPSRAGSPDTPEPVSPAASEETASSTITTRNTMSLPTNTGEASTAEGASQTPVQIAGFTDGQLVEFLWVLRETNDHQGPKVKPPPRFGGDRSQLRTWLVQCNMYFGATRVTSDTDRIAYTKSLLRDAAAKWMTPCAEGSRPETWTNWDGFVDALKGQCADVEAENSARTKIERMNQASKTFTDYWNEFRLTATEANYDDKTMQRLLLRGASRIIQDAWAQDNRMVDNVDDLAGWAIEKENRINFVKSLQKSGTTTRTDNTPRNPNGTYPPANNNNQDYGDPRDLDATRRQPRLNISREEFQRRMRERLCLKCGKPGHQISECGKEKSTRPFNPQTKSWQPTKKPAAWQARQQIREIDIESLPEQSGNEESPQ